MNRNDIKIGSNRSFGVVFFIVFLIISIYPLLNNENIRIWSLVISIIFLILGLLNSKLLNPLNKIWFKFGLFLGAIISPIVMGIIFFFCCCSYRINNEIDEKRHFKIKKK